MSKPSRLVIILDMLNILHGGLIEHGGAYRYKKIVKTELKTITDYIMENCLLTTTFEISPLDIHIYAVIREHPKDLLILENKESIGVTDTKVIIELLNQHGDGIPSSILEYNTSFIRVADTKDADDRMSINIAINEAKAGSNVVMFTDDKMEGGHLNEIPYRRTVFRDFQNRIGCLTSLEESKTEHKTTGLYGKIVVISPRLLTKKMDCILFKGDILSFKTYLCENRKKKRKRSTKKKSHKKQKT